MTLAERMREVERELREKAEKHSAQWLALKNAADLIAAALKAAGEEKE